MGIVVINQTNEQECGVCVLTSLHNYFYKHDIIDKNNTLDLSNISKEGMSIFDFEVSANKLGLECESYEIKWSEFINLKINSYFVLLLSNYKGLSNHYVICKKKSRNIEIYDSCTNHKIEVSYSDLKKWFMNVIILVTKKPNKTFKTNFDSTKTLILLDLKFVIFNILLSLLILATSVLSAGFLNWIIDLSIGKNSITNLLTICFVFIVVYFSNDLLNYINNLYNSKQLKSYLLLFTNKVLSSLKSKKLSFLNKVDKDWIFKIDECIFSISNFCVSEINKLISNSIFAAICMCIIGITEYRILIFCGLILIIQFIFFLFSYRKKKELFTSTIKIENKNINCYKQLTYSLLMEQWEGKKNHLIDQIKMNYSSLYKNFHDSIIFKNNLNIFKSLLRSLIEITLVGTIGYLIIKNNNLTIGTLTFLTATIALYKNSTAEIFNYFLSKIEFDLYWQVYRDIVGVDNLSQEKTIMNFEDIKIVKLKTSNQEISFSIAKDNYLESSLIDILSNSKFISIDQNNYSLNDKSVSNNIIVCDENTILNLEHFIKLFEVNPEMYAPFIRYFKINLNNSNQNFYNKNILNLLSLIPENKKIIFIDSILDFFNQEDKWMVKDILNSIRKNNFVFITRKEKHD